MKTFAILLLCLKVASAEPVVVNISIETDIYDYAQEILAGKSPIEITNFEAEHSQRDVVEFILVQKALALGGANLTFSFITGNYDSRNPKLLKNGLLLINFDTMWLSHAQQFSEDVYISDPIIHKGEYLAGVYTSLEHKNKLNIKNLSDFQNITAISNKNWPVDWQTLSQLNLYSLTHEEEWLSMAKLVTMGWVDIMLAPFTKSNDFSYQGDNYHIVAIEGIKIALNDSRHFIVSKKHPQGEETFNALQKGLKILRKQGLIRKAYQQSGFFNEKTEDWLIINQSLLK